MKWRNTTQTFIFVNIFLFRFFHPTWSLTILTSFFRPSPLKQNFSSLTHPRVVSNPESSCQELEFCVLVWIGNPTPFTGVSPRSLQFRFAICRSVAVQMLSGRCELWAGSGLPCGHLAVVNVAPSPG